MQYRSAIYVDLLILREHRCKFKSDKISYSKSQPRTTYCLTKNKPVHSHGDIESPWYSKTDTTRVPNPAKTRKKPLTIVVKGGMFVGNLDTLLRFVDEDHRKNSAIFDDDLVP